MLTNVYVDGFNLYYGCLKGGPFKWLNLEALFDQLLPRNKIQTIHYCTARSESRPHDPDIHVRQDAYLRALATLPRVKIHYGAFLSSAVRAPEVVCGPDGKPQKEDGRLVVRRTAAGKPYMHTIYKSEEKGSDVNLASHLLRDAFQGAGECAVVVSNDSDLLTPVSMVREHGIVVGLILPRRKGSLELRRLANFQKELRPSFLAGAQFPETIAGPSGHISKPGTW